MINKPAISVVMSAYNASGYVDDAIKSILNQTFKDFEFIIINDGSTDDTLAKIKSYKDPRIKIIDQDNKGLVTSLNTGIASAATNIIARQDADDLSHPDRLYTQYNSLLADSNIVVLGSSIFTINEHSETINTHRVLLGDAELKQELIIRSPFAHGSVMFKKAPFTKAGGYQNNDWPAEDYGLWLRMSKFGRFANVDEPLYFYRENSAGISAQNQTKQDEKKTEVQMLAWEKRSQLCKGPIRTKIYKKLDMGEIRIERISHNINKVLIKSAKCFAFATSFRLARIILSDKNLTRKSARFLLIKLKLKHA